MSILPAGKAGRGVLALLLSLATWGTQAANIPDRDDYAWGFPLSVTGDQGFHTRCLQYIRPACAEDF